MTIRMLSGLLLLALTAGCQPAWRVIGPGGGGAQFHPTISPHDPQVVLVACDMSGSYLTKDGGKNWRMINLRGTVRFFVFDPSNPAVMYAQNNALWRSTDGGARWHLVHPAPAEVRGVVIVGDHAEERIMTSTGAAETITSLAVDPGNSAVLYAAFRTPGKVTLRVSKDNGGSWLDLRDAPSGASRIYVDARSPARDRTLYVVGNDSLLVREAGEWRNASAQQGAGNFISSSGGFAASGSFTLYANTANTLYVTRDGGASWKTMHPAPVLTAVATSLRNPGVVYLSYRGLKDDGQTFSGVAVSSDFGATWTYPWKEARAKAPNVDDGWVSERFGPGWGENPIALGVAPGSPDICYGTDFGRTLRSIDRGKTWEAAYTRKLADGSFTTNGMDVTTNYGVHFDPFDRNRVFISYTDIGLFRSENGGKSWTSATTQGVPRPWVNTTYWVEFDPDVRGRMWAVMSGTHDLPRPKMWRRASPASYVGGVAQSDDGGRSWRPLTNGIPPTAATHILLDRRSTAAARVLYVAGFGKGVFKSTDGGASWSARNNGLPAVEPFAWRLAQDRDGVLYLVVARRSEGPAMGTAGDGALYRSRDGAETWEKMALPEEVNGPNGIAVDPGDPSRLYLACWEHPVNGQPAGGGIYLSTDRGVTWRRVLARDQHIYDVTIDPRRPRILYASGFESSAWRSSDRGATWQRIRGYNFKWGHRVIPDPSDADKIYVTTFGGSVWHGPAAGDPKAVEDIVTPVMLFPR